jgi:adenylate cyclase
VAERDHAWTALFGGHDVEACARTALATSATLMGLPDTGATHAAEGEAFTRELNHPFSHALMLFHRGLVFQLQGQVAAARQIAGQVRAICTEQGIPVYRLHGELLEAWCIGMDDEPRLAIAKMRRALSALDVLQGRARRSYFLGLLADLCQRSGDLEQAGAALEEALGFAEATGERFYLAELHRLGGILHVARGACGVTDAETCFHHALAIAREQEARLLELRTATSLARLWGEQGERRKAHDLLAPIYGRFTEGFNTLDLIEARQLIETLA